MIRESSTASRERLARLTSRDMRPPSSHRRTRIGLPIMLWYRLEIDLMPGTLAAEGALVLIR